MKYSIELSTDSSKAWVDTVLGDFDTFLQDHANCERKASAMAMSFVAKYPDRKEIIPELIATAIEELEHFDMVYRIMEKRGVTLAHEIGKDLYMKQLIDFCRSGREERFLDRLLVASLVECRGAERFKMVGKHIEGEDLMKFYTNLGISEGKHCHLFLKMAHIYFPEEEIEKRLPLMIEKEGEILENMELKAALH